MCRHRVPESSDAILMTPAFQFKGGTVDLLAQLHTEPPLLKQDLGSGCGGSLRAILLYAVNYRLRDPLSKRETRCNVAAEMYS